MNIIDIVIILLIIMSGIIGMKRGFFKEIVMTAGWLLVFIIAWYLKNPLADFLSLNLPFFNFWGDFKGVTAINIFLYQLIAFIIVYTILMIIFRVVVSITGLFEKFLDATIILGIPSKILGFILGLLEGYVLTFIIIFVIAQPIFNFDIVNESSFKTAILDHTPVLSNTVKGANNTIKDIIELKEEFSSNSKKEDFNRECIRVMLKHKFVSAKYVQKLVDAKKIKISGVETIIHQYR